MFRAVSVKKETSRELEIIIDEKRERISWSTLRVTYILSFDL
jgi:hypothetical protein